MTIHLSDLPAVNAGLNATSAILLLCGYVAIRSKKITVHRAFMTTAFACSTLFLISYLVYHFNVGSIPFGGQGWIRPLYFLMLITHIILAAALLPLVLVTLTRALRGRFEAHRRIARWTFPIWMYVSVTGVLIYVALYHVYGPAPTDPERPETGLTARIATLEYPLVRAPDRTLPAGQNPRH